MRTTLLCSSVTLLSCALALVAGSARAQDAAQPPVATTPATPPTTEAPPQPTQETPATTDATVAAPPPAEAPAEDAPIPAWIRIDSDGSYLQLWAGATHPLGEGIGLASDIYISSGGSLAEFDIGPAIAGGPFTITPMLGFQVDWSQKRANSLVPQLYVTGGPDPIYAEFWLQTYLNTVFNEGTNNDIFLRLFVDYKVGKYFGLGPQIEPTLALNETTDAAGNTRETGLSSLVVGGNVMLTQYGKGSTMFLFLGYETNEDARNAVGGGGLAGRFTYVYNF